MNISELVFQKLPRPRLLELIRESLENCGYSVAQLDNEEARLPFSPLKITNTEGVSTILQIYPKNLSGAGWSDKPEIKRIQIQKLPSDFRSSKSEIFLLCGVCSYRGKKLYAFWNPSNYVTHSTCCSCYVYVSSLNKAYENGMFHGLNKGKFVLTCREDCLTSAIDELSSRYC